MSARAAHLAFVHPTISFCAVISTKICQSSVFHFHRIILISSHPLPHFLNLLESSFPFLLFPLKHFLTFIVPLVAIMNQTATKGFPSITVWSCLTLVWLTSWAIIIITKYSDLTTWPSSSDPPRCSRHPGALRKTGWIENWTKIKWVSDEAGTVELHFPRLHIARDLKIGLPEGHRAAHGTSHKSCNLQLRKDIWIQQQGTENT